MSQNCNKYIFWVNQFKPLSKSHDANVGLFWISFHWYTERCFWIAWVDNGHHTLKKKTVFWCKLTSITRYASKQYLLLIQCRCFSNNWTRATMRIVIDTLVFLIFGRGIKVLSLELCILYPARRMFFFFLFVKYCSYYHSNATFWWRVEFQFQFVVGRQCSARPTSILYALFKIN